MALLDVQGSRRIAPRQMPPWEKALLERSKALNDMYNLGGSAPPGSGAGAPPPGQGQGAPPPTPGSPGSIGIPGYDPDYGSLITGDANVVALGGDLDAMNSRLINSRQAAIRRAIINAGLTPNTSVADLDDATLEATKANQFSQAAELGRQRGRRSTDLRSQLANRGILGGGALAGGESRLQEDYERGSSQVLSQLLGFIENAETQTSDRQADIVRQRAASREAAAQRIQADPRYRPIGKATAKLDAASGFYVTADGRWYDPQGGRVEAPEERVDIAAGSRAAPSAALSSSLAALGDEQPLLFRGNGTREF